MARTQDPKLHALWRDRVRRQEASGLTIAQFCAQECVARQLSARLRPAQIRFLMVHLPWLESASPPSVGLGG